MDCRMTHKSCAKTASCVGRTRWTDLWYSTAEHASTMLSTERNVATSGTERFITKSFEEVLLLYPEIADYCSGHSQVPGKSGYWTIGSVGHRNVFILASRLQLR